MNLISLAQSAQKVIKSNSPAILTALGVSGTIGTAYLAGKASYRAAIRIRDHEYMEARENNPTTIGEKIELVWDLYIPAVAAGAVTVGSIVAANHISSKRTAAAYSLLAVAEKGFAEYREKAIEVHGEKKDQLIREEIAKDHIRANPPGETIVVGSGPVMCCELFTGRYFNCDMEKLRKSQNDVNAKLMSDMYVTLSDFYYMIGVPPTSDSGRIGWESDKQLSLDFTSILCEDGRPCLAFDYNYTKVLT